MKFTILVAVALSVALVNSLPFPQNELLRSKVLERLMMVEGDNAEALRSKRTIGVLRQLFPEVSKIVEQKVNAITSEIIRILGPTVLRGVLGRGAGGGGTGGTSRSKTSDVGTTVELALPDDDDDDSSSADQKNAGVSISLPTFPPDVEDDTPQTTTVASSTTTTATSVKPSIENRKRRKRHVEWKRLARDVNPEAEDRVIEDTAESQNNEVRVQFADDLPSPATNEAVESELAPLEDIEVSDDENRNKRLINFGFGASGGAGGAAGANAGSGGGSGNFLFDIIRQAADGAARAAGTVYRVVAGTQSLGLGLSATRDVAPAPVAAPAPSAPAAAPAAAPAPSAPAAMPAPAAAPVPGAGMTPPLIAGSGSSQANDVAAGAPSPGGRVDGTAEAVPGPVTRLFVIANRGISNLIQDLILRLAATSERIVNFKARLITSII